MLLGTDPLAGPDDEWVDEQIDDYSMTDRAAPAFGAWRSPSSIDPSVEETGRRTFAVLLDLAHGSATMLSARAVPVFVRRVRPP